MSGDFSELLSLPHTDAEQKWLREKLETLSPKESAILTALLSWKEPKTAADAVNLLLNVSRCEVYFPVSDYADLGERYLKEQGVKLPDGAEKFTDMEAMGRICEQKSPGQFVGDCYVLHPGQSLWEPYSAQNPESLSDGWNIRVRLASESCPEGVWIHLPDYNFIEDELTGEIGIALRRLGAEDIGECRILDAQCDVPGVDNIPAQYDSVEALIYDANNMGFILEERGQGAPDFREKFAAALEYENCATLADAVGIGGDADYYEVVKTENLRGFAEKRLDESGVLPEIRAAVNPEKYGERLLLDSGFRKSRDGRLFVGRADRLKERWEERSPTRNSAKRRVGGAR